MHIAYDRSIILHSCVDILISTSHQAHIGQRVQDMFTECKLTSNTYFSQFYSISTVRLNIIYVLATLLLHVYVIFSIRLSRCEIFLYLTGYLNLLSSAVKDQLVKVLTSTYL